MAFENAPRWPRTRWFQRSFSKHRLWLKQAQVLKLSADARRRLSWFVYHDSQASQHVTSTCRHFNIARKTFYRWQKVFDPSNLRTLETRSKAPQKRRTRMISPLQEQRICELRRSHIRWGKMKLKSLYEQAYHEPISSWKIQYTLKRYQLYYNPSKNERLARIRKRNQHKKRITELKLKPFPGFLLAVDAIVRYGQGYKRYILTAVDACSKIAFARMYTSKSSRNAADFLKRLVYLLDGSVLNTLTDNGSEFHKEFLEACKKLGITKYWSRVRTPQDNAMNERFNRTLQEEFVALGNFSYDPVVFNQKLTDWLVEYNFERPHQALGYQTPFGYYQHAAKVLPKYPSHTIP